MELRFDRVSRHWCKLAGMGTSNSIWPTAKNVGGDASMMHSFIEAL
jgi:hypothetical protein